MDKTRSTIAAIATPPGSGGIGIIKISGPEAPNIAARLFRRPLPSSDATGEMAPMANDQWKSHRFYYGFIVHPQTLQVLDEVMAVLMRGPRSYTREDVVEIHVHSGQAVLRAVLESVLSCGAVPASPGEFTKRAFINGRIDLTQAEGVIDLINARTERSREIAAVQVRGEMNNRISEIRNVLLNIMTEFEAAIDFPEDVEESTDSQRALLQLRNQVIDPLSELLRQYDNAHVLRDGVKVVIAGRPNVGKSSLMNRLMGKERAIVTPVPGTTRDTIEDVISIQGIPIVLTDTAGLHHTDDPVERIGIERAHSYIQEADIVLFMTEASQAPSSDDFLFLQNRLEQKIIWVVNKSDLIDASYLLPQPPVEFATVPRISISAKENSGINALMALITQTAVDENIFRESLLVPNFRQKDAIETGLQHAKAAADGLDIETPTELICIDIQSSLDTLGEVIGVVFQEDILDHIFSRFCIGK